MARKATTNQARALRRMTPSMEKYLWKLLRDRRLEGLKFRRQFPIGPYVLDFVCLHHRLIVEADGPFHDPEHDAKRDAWLAAQGFRVLRFDNKLIGGSDYLVLNRIRAAVGKLGPIGEI
jgi:very-short-patch-repair endonuclease